MSQPDGRKLMPLMGVREIVVFPSTDEQGTDFDYTAGVRLDAAQTMTAQSARQTVDITGDDKKLGVATTQRTIDWTLGAGSVPLAAWAIMDGGKIYSKTGKKIYRGSGDDLAPYFSAIGRVVSPFGGDQWLILYRCIMTGNMGGDHQYNQVHVTQANGQAVPMLADGALLWDVVEYAASTAIGATAGGLTVPTKGSTGWSDFTGGTAGA